ncbi:MAG: hypothetical protein NTY53_15840 [Kiritimatiellaeota bacterium]|nr:hypothetical protein [Kiritimatiellota bacterium]
MGWVFQWLEDFLTTKIMKDAKKTEGKPSGFVDFVRFVVQFFRLGGD